MAHQALSEMDGLKHAEDPESEKNIFLRNIFVDIRRQTTESLELSPLGNMILVNVNKQHNQLQPCKPT